MLTYPENMPCTVCRGGTWTLSRIESCPSASRVLHRLPFQLSLPSPSASALSPDPRCQSKRQEVGPLCYVPALLYFKISTVTDESTSLVFSSPAYDDVTLYSQMSIRDVLPEDKIHCQINWFTKGQLGWHLAVWHLGIFFCQFILKERNVSSNCYKHRFVTNRCHNH